MSNLNDYFALAAPNKIGEKLFEKVSQNDTASGFLAELKTLWARAYLYYYGRAYNGAHLTSAMSRGGQQGELAEIRVNHSRALVKNVVNLITSSKVVWEPKATNQDFESIRQTVLARYELEYYWHDRGVAQIATRCLESALAFMEGYLLILWDEFAGPLFAAEEGAPPTTTGDLEFLQPMPWDVIRDETKPSWDQLDWVIVRVARNKYDLAARYPAQAQKILAMSDDALGANRVPPQIQRASAPPSSDSVSCYYFYHKRTAVLPKGRETIFLSSNLVLQDGDLTYESIPLHRVTESELAGTPYGYSQYYEILGIQELVDSLETTVASNQTTFGTQMISVPQGSDVSPDSFGAMRIMTYPPNAKPPEALQLTRSPPEVFAHIQQKVRDMEQIMLLNEAVRGQVRSGEQSGAALALLTAQATQQASALQQSFLRMLQTSGLGVIETIRTKCPFPRRVAVTGLANRALERYDEYIPGELGDIRRVMVDIGNPLAQNVAGRRELADMYIQLGLVKTPEQLEQVITSGRLEPLTQSLQQELLLIRYENERLSDGEEVPAMVDDDHVLHMREHRAEVSNPEVRFNPAAFEAYARHQDEHWALYLSADPARLITFGQQPPPQPAPMPEGPGPGRPPGPPSPDEASLQPPAPEMPNLPQMPTNPATGEQAPAPAGSLVDQ